MPWLCENGDNSWICKVDCDAAVVSCEAGRVQRQEHGASGVGEGLHIISYGGVGRGGIARFVPDEAQHVGFVVIICCRAPCEGSFEVA